MSEQKTKHSTQIDDIESICSDLLRNDSEIQFVMYEEIVFLSRMIDAFTYCNLI